MMPCSYVSTHGNVTVSHMRNDTSNKATLQVYHR